MNISVFDGDLTAAPVEAICTSTNPRLSLMMGTGGAVRERGGFEVLRACEQLIEAEFRRSGRRVLPIGSAHLAPAGSLPYKAVIHCVASDERHKSSPAVIRACVTNALEIAAKIGVRSVAMPVFATGHAAFPFDQAVAAMLEALEKATHRADIMMVVPPDRAEEVKGRLLRLPQLHAVGDE